MHIFVSKHYSSSRAQVFTFLIQGAMWLRAGFTVIKRLVKKNRLHVPNKTTHHSIAIAGSAKEFEQLQHLLVKAGRFKSDICHVAVDHKTIAAGNMNLTAGVAGNPNYREIIFCEGYLSFSEIIVLLQQVPAGVYARFHARNSGSIIGSESKDTAGQSLSTDGYLPLLNPGQSIKEAY